MTPKATGAAWEAIVREAAEQLDPRWTVVGRGAKTVLTWGLIGWVWESVGLDLKSGDSHDLYASRSWLDVPFRRTITAVAQDVLPSGSTDRSFSLGSEGAVDQLRRWADVVPAEVFTNTLDQDLDELEGNFALFQKENARLPWVPLAGLRVVFGRDALPVIDEVDAFVGSAGAAGPDASFFQHFRSQLEHGREPTLRWLDDHRRATLRAERVPDDLVEPVLDASAHH